MPGYDLKGCEPGLGWEIRPGTGYDKRIFIRMIQKGVGGDNWRFRSDFGKGCPVVAFMLFIIIAIHLNFYCGNSGLCR